MAGRPCRNLIEDAPPEGGGRVIVGQGSCGGRRPYEQGGVEAGPGEVAQPFCQLRQERVWSHTGYFSSEQLLPSPLCVGICGGESHLESLLEDSGAAVELARPGGSLVAGLDLGGRAPYLQLGDQLSRQESVQLGRPRWRFSSGVAADLVSELSDQL
jgi:hypothetical protein